MSTNEAAERLRVYARQLPGFPFDLLDAALAAERSAGAAPLDVEALRHYLWSERHELKHRGDGYYESCVECLRAAESVLVDLVKGTDR